MTVANIKKIAELIATKTRELSPFAANVDNQGNDITYAKKLEHREIQLLASRISKKYDKLQILEQIYNWHIDLSSDQSRPLFGQIKIQSHQTVLHYLQTIAANDGLRTRKFLEKAKFFANV